MPLIWVPVGRLPSPTLKSIRDNTDNLAHWVPMSTCQRLEALGNRGDDVPREADASPWAVCAVRFCGTVDLLDCQSDELVGSRTEETGAGTYGSIVYV